MKARALVEAIFRQHPELVPASKIRAAEQIIDNYLNGNIQDAKAMARRASDATLLSVLMNDYGYSEEAAQAVVNFLKYGGPTFWL
jgi:hypothetical protein